MTGHFLRIGFTLPIIFPGGVNTEAAHITELLDGDIDIFHIRKPGTDINYVRNLIKAIPPAYRPRLRIHDYFDLATEFGLGGVHLNSRNPIPPADCHSVSRSCHTLKELDMQLPDGRMPEYQTLSPIFDSISKPGYDAKFDLSSIHPYIIGKRVVALGGVTPDSFAPLRQAGFIGAAMLGCLWK